MAIKEIDDFDPKTVLIGSEELLLQETGGGTVKKTTINDLHRLKVGFVDYGDSATIITPITHNGGGAATLLTNDTLAISTNELYLPTGITSLWNSVDNAFDWTELSLGDMVDLRVDLVVTTISPNTELEVYMELAQGAGGAYQIELEDVFYKGTGIHRMVSYTGGYMGDANTLNNPASLYVDSTNDVSIVVNGWYLKVTRR